MCDVVYALLLERLEQDVRAERQVAAVLIGAGVKEIDVPDYLTARERFDAALCAAPTRQDRKQIELRKALGLRS